MTVQPKRRATLDVACLVDAIDYGLRPQLARLGGDLWLDEFEGDRFILGFRAPPGQHERTLEWLREALAAICPGAAALIELRDYSVRQT